MRLSDLKVANGVGIVQRIAVDIVKGVHIFQSGFAVLERPQNFFPSIRILNAELPDHDHTFLSCRIKERLKVDGNQAFLHPFFTNYPKSFTRDLYSVELGNPKLQTSK